MISAQTPLEMLTPFPPFFLIVNKEVNSIHTDREALILALLFCKTDLISNINQLFSQAIGYHFPTHLFNMFRFS